MKKILILVVLICLLAVGIFIFGKSKTGTILSEKNKVLTKDNISIYFDNQRLYYVANSVSDVAETFALHIYPLNYKYLTAENQKLGFFNYDFKFKDNSNGWLSFFSGKEVAQIQLPDFKINGIATGQYTDEGRIWREEVILANKSTQLQNRKNLYQGNFALLENLKVKSIDVYPVGLERYKVEFVFNKCGEALENNRVALHAYPYKSDFAKISGKYRDIGHINWDFKPQDLTVVENGCVASTIVSAKLLRYQKLYLRLYTPGKGGMGEPMVLSDINFNL